MYVPGDNDIGGENGDQITPAKRNRFAQSFSGSDIIKVNHVKLYKLNHITYDVPNDSTASSYAGVNIGFTHMSILITPGGYARKVMNDIRPQIIFSAHLHESAKMYNTQTLTRTNIQHQYLLAEHKKDEIDLTDREIVWEIMVPTCSYRMGVKNIGYGVAVIGEFFFDQYSILN